MCQKEMVADAAPSSALPPPLPSATPPPAAPPVPPAPPVGEVAVDEEAEGSVFVLCLRDAWVWMGSVYVETGRGRATTHGHCFCLLTRCCSGQERLS